jgi:hypothetical protein
MLAELPAAAQKDFDYVIGEPGADDPRFVEYKGAWYDVYDVQYITTQRTRPVGHEMVVDPSDPLAQWHAVISESYFSGVLFRYPLPHETDDVIVGRYTA